MKRESGASPGQSRCCETPWRVRASQPLVRKDREGLGTGVSQKTCQIDSTSGTLVLLQSIPSPRYLLALRLGSACLMCRKKCSTVRTRHSAVSSSNNWAADALSGKTPSQLMRKLRAKDGSDVRISQGIQRRINGRCGYRRSTAGSGSAPWRGSGRDPDRCSPDSCATSG